MKQNFLKKIIFGLFIFGVLGACKKDELPSDFKRTHSDVVVLNEGPFGTPGASISIYNPVAKSVANKVYEAQNGSVIGEILQSAYWVDDKLMAILNVSGVLEVMDTADFSSDYRIEGLTNARYMAMTDATTAYLTTIFASSIYKVDLSNGGSILDTIAAPAWTEDIEYIGDELFVSNRSGSEILILDPKTDTFTDTIDLGYGPNAMMLDKQGMLWVYCAGDAWSSPQIPASIYKVNPDTRSAEQVLVFDDLNTNGATTQMAMNAARDTVYITRKDVRRFSIDNPRAIESFYGLDGISLYGLGVDPINGDVYLADAMRFSQNGLVIRVDAQANVVDSFRVGISPNGFLFR